MTLRRENCEFGCTEVKFLGHVVSEPGVRPDSDKIAATVNMSSPTNRTGLEGSLVW